MRVVIRFLWIISGVLVVCWPALLWALPAAILPSATPTSITGAAEVFRDVGGQRTFAAVLQQSSTGFVPLTGNASFGFTTDAIWLRFRVTNRHPHWLVVQPSFLDEVSLFVPTGNGHYAEHRQGDHVPLSQRPFPFRAAVFALPVSDAPVTYYLRIASSSSLPISAMLYIPEAYLDQLNQEQVFFGFLFGMVVLAMGFSLLCLLWMPRPIYRLTLQYLAWFLLYQLSVEGFDQLWLYPQHPAYADKVLVASMGMLFSTMTRLYQVFFRVDAYWPRFSRIYALLWRGQSLFSLLVLLGMDIRWVSPSLQIFSGGVFVLSLWLIVQAIRRNYPHASLFLWIHATPAFALVLTAFRTFGWLPFNGLTAHPTALVSPLQVALLGVLMVLSVRDVERENREAQTQALRLAYQLEEDLENTIAVRTQALTEEITQHQRTALALHEAKEHAERMLVIEQTRQQQQQQFIHMIAHELRTPLAIIEAAVRMIEVLTEKVMPELASRFSKIQRAMRRLTSVIDNSLADGRLSAGKLTPQLASVLLSDFIQGIRQQIVVPDGITLTFMLVPADLVLQVDAFLLRLALLNLIDNAIKYSPNGGEVRVSIMQQATYVTCVVEDQGRGIPANALAHLFTKFYRVQAHEKIPGVGLGLYLVQQVAQLHGGSVHVDSQEGVGSRFTLQILG